MQPHVQLLLTGSYRLNQLLAELRTLDRKVNSLGTPDQEQEHRLGVLRVSYQTRVDDLGTCQVTQIQVDTFVPPESQFHDDADSMRFLRRYMFTLDGCPTMMLVDDEQVRSIRSFDTLSTAFVDLLEHLCTGLALLKDGLDRKIEWVDKKRASYT